MGPQVRSQRKLRYMRCRTVRTQIPGPVDLRKLTRRIPGPTHNPKRIDAVRFRVGATGTPRGPSVLVWSDGRVLMGSMCTSTPMSYSDDLPAVRDAMWKGRRPPSTKTGKRWRDLIQRSTPMQRRALVEQWWAEALRKLHDAGALDDTTPDAGPLMDAEDGHGWVAPL